MDRVTVIGDRGAPGQGRGGANMKRQDANRHQYAEVANEPRHALDNVEDVTSLFGMSDGAVPGPVQARIVALMEEVERLRNELAQARRHESMLRDLADHHPTLPIQHRRAFLRELTKLLNQAERNSLTGSVIHLHVSGIEALREAQGHDAAEAALAKAIEILRGMVEPVDTVGYLEGGSFGVALAMVGEADAQSRAKHMAERLGGMALLWNGAKPAFAVRWSVTPFVTGHEAEELLRAAELAQRSRPTAKTA